MAHHLVGGPAIESPIRKVLINERFMMLWFLEFGYLYCCEACTLAFAR